MEAARVEGYGNVEVTTDSYTLSAPATPPALAEQFDSPKFDPALTSSAKRRKVKGTNQDSQEKDTPPSVSNCYVFKSRLQEYCQKAGLTTPVYETIKEGPSHEPSFKSTVIVNNVRYDSLPGFFNRKAAEQSAAEVALVELANSTDVKFRISQPVHETGLCKNLLQEYAQKMNYAMPLYECSKEEKEGRTPMYSCVVEIGGIKYIGASASTKKEAEIKAARTALLAIQTATPVSEDQTGNSIYTVIPQKKRVSDLKISSQETKAALKPKKGRFKKQQRKKKQGVRMDNSAGGTSHLEVNADGHDGVGLGVKDAVSSGPYMVIGGLEVYMDHQGVVEVDATDASSSQDKTNGGSDIHTEGQRQEMSITNVVSSQGMDSGPPETTTNACETNAVSSQGVDSGPSETTTNACVTNAVSAQGMDSGPSETTTNACVTNAVSSQGVDSGPSETTTNACVTNDVSSQGLDTGLAKTTTNTRVSNAVSSQVMDSEPSETTRNACTTHNGNLENACVPLMDDARMRGLQ